MGVANGLALAPDQPPKADVLVVGAEGGRNGEADPDAAFTVDKLALLDPSLAKGEAVDENEPNDGWVFLGTAGVAVVLAEADAGAPEMTLAAGSAFACLTFSAISFGRPLPFGYEVDPCAVADGLTAAKGEAVEEKEEKVG